MKLLEKCKVRCRTETREPRSISAEQTVRERMEMAGKVQKRPPEEQTSPGADWRHSLAPVKSQDSKARRSSNSESMHDAHPGAQ